MNKPELDRQLTQDFKEVFGGENGKRVLDRLTSLSTIEKSGVSSDRRNKIDVNRLIYDEGQRAVLLYINKQINKDLGKER